MNADDSHGLVHFPTHEYRPFTGGIAVYVEETVKACAANGGTPVVWAPDYGQAVSQDEPIRIIRVPMRGKQDWVSRWRMGTALVNNLGRRPFRGTVVLAEPGPIRWWMYSPLTRPPRPARLIAILHGSELKQFCSNPWHKLLFGRLLQQVDCIGVVSNAIRALALDAFPFIAPRIRVVPGSVRTSMQPMQVPDWGARKKEILQVGRLHPRKGQLELVEAFGCLPEALRKTYRLRLVGPHSRPSYVDRVRKAASDRSIQLDLPGELDESELVQAYCDARLFAMPSRNYKSSIEGLGLALLEAQFFGCPVVAANVGGVAEAMQPDASGILVPPDDSAKLAAAIQSILEQPGWAEALGKQGRQFVKESFSWRRNVEAMGLI